MAKHLLLILAFLTAVCNNAYAVKPEIFSSPSTTQRILEMEKTPDFKTFTNKIKKQYRQIKDIAVERWTNGETYYVLYCKNNEFGLMRPSDSIPLFSDKDYLGTKPHLELATLHGHTLFKLDDTHYCFGQGDYRIFNPLTDVKKYGNEYYVELYKNPTHIYNLNGTHLLMDETIEFRDATPAGFTTDATSGLSIYHPALPPRFFGTTKTEHLREYGQPVAYSLGFFESPNSQFNIKLPGGEYYIYRQLESEYGVKSEVRTDPNGNLHEYKVFEVGSKKYIYGLPTSLCLHGGTTGKPIIKGKIDKLKISTPDQIVYYSVYDKDSLIYRTGCVSLLDSTFTIPPRFADINVFYDDEQKPYALVRLSSIGNYEFYDPSKTYDYSSMSPLELAYERKNWNKVISQIKTDSINDFKEQNLMIWFKAETEILNDKIDLMEQKVRRFATNNLYEIDKDELERDANGTSSWYFPVHFSYDYQIEDAFELFAKKYTGDKADNYTTLAAYVRDLRKRINQLVDDVAEAKKDYLKRQREARQQMELAKIQQMQQQLIDDMNARQLDNARRQAVMLQVLGTVTGIIKHALTPTPSQRQVTTSGTVMAAPTGYTPSSSSSSSTPSSTSSSSSSTSSRICHACYGSGKCPHCHGAGRYAPNTNGRQIECTSCNKSGQCHACNGTGHH